MGGREHDLLLIHTYFYYNWSSYLEGREGLLFVRVLRTHSKTPAAVSPQWRNVVPQCLSFLGVLGSWN